jgi:pyridoxine kinase
MQRQKRVLAIHDVSCFGRCSLTVALPIISAAGIETTVLPTAVLSTHTGGFTGFTYRDLTQDILPIVNHWQNVGIEFDAIYTGFLGSFEQLDIVSSIFDMMKKQGVLVIVDPVMADYGKLYSIFPSNFPDGMRQLCRKADVIVPNLTEAAFLLDEPYHDGPHTQTEIEHILHALSSLGPAQVIVTGVSYDGEQLGSASYDANTGELSYTSKTRIDPMYHGTGDVFASAAVAALLGGRTLAQANDIAVRFTVASIARTKDAATDNRFGVNFEAGLAELNDLITKY